MPQPWDREYRRSRQTFNGPKEERVTLVGLVGRIAEIVMFSAVVYAAAVKHHYVNRNKR